MVNLDTLDILDLEEFVAEYSDNINLRTAKDYFEADRRKKSFDNVDLLRALHYHVGYAILKLSWYDDRANNKIEYADTTEEILETLLSKMPKFARW